MEVLALMGIRGGSKGLPGKNVRLLAGKPLFKWGIDAAKRSSFVGRVIVSTDSEEYRQLVLDNEIESPYLRPNKFATDGSPEIDFIANLLEWLEQNEGYCPDICVRLLATVPMQLEDDIDKSVSMLVENNQIDSSVVIAESRQHPVKALEILDDTGLCVPYGKTTADTGDITPKDRAQYKKSYHRANIITFKPENIKKYGSLTGMMCLPHVISQDRAIDIDTEVDFWCAEAIMNKLNWSGKY